MPRGLCWCLEAGGRHAAPREDKGKLFYRLDCQMCLLGPKPAEPILWVSGQDYKKIVSHCVILAILALQVLGVILCPNQGNYQSSQCWNTLVSHVEKSEV